jgi:serine/threonine protein kinase/Tfp pilus assembly protein PilF
MGGDRCDAQEGRAAAPRIQDHAGLLVRDRYNPTVIPSGSRLGPYEVGVRLGAGGMGEVYRATDTRLGRDVAIKVLPAHSSTDEEMISALTREAKAIAALSHPNILAVYELDQEGGTTYVVTELLEGETLRERLRGGPLPWRRAVEIAASIADALAAAHARGIIHRDVKPENVFITTEGLVKVLDFGLALTRQPVTDAPENATEVRVDDGKISGTIGYMSPEQVVGGDIDATSDIFSLGCLIYETLSGLRPFQRSATGETLAAILREDPPPLSLSGSSLPQELARLALHCLEKKPSERFQSARDLAFALRATLTDSASGTIASTVAPKKKQSRSIAVLPFVNVGSDANTEYLSDGITETLINHLAQLPKMRVIARATAFRYKGTTTDATAAGRELDVDMIVTGRVQQFGDMLRISAELVDVRDDRQLWGENFNRKMADVFAVQDEISSQIAEKLRANLTGVAKRRLKKRDPRTAEAYQLYLKGRFYWNKRTAENFQKGIEAFREAIDLDPTYALAYAGLADCYNLLNTYSVLAAHDAFPKAKAAATRALELDDSLPEAHASLAFVTFFYEWKAAAAEESFQRAIKLNPNYGTAHHWYGWFLIMRGRFDEAAASMKRARDVDPLSIIIQTESVWPFFYARDYDRALGQLKKAMDIDRDFLWIHFALGQIYLEQRNIREALVELEMVVQRYDTPYVLIVLGRAYGLAGRMDDAKRIHERVQSVALKEFVSAYDLAIMYTGVDDRDRVFAELEKAYEAHDPWIVRLDVDPAFDRVRDDPRFRNLRMRIGL